MTIKELVVCFAGKTSEDFAADAAAGVSHPQHNGHLPSG